MPLVKDVPMIRRGPWAPGSPLSLGLRVALFVLIVIFIAMPVAAVLGSALGAALGSDGEHIIGLLLVLAVISAVYSAPSLIARHRDHPQRMAIGVLNLFLGWTFVGWVIALVWPFTTNKKPAPATQTPLVVSPSPEPIGLTASAQTARKQLWPKPVSATSVGRPLRTRLWPPLLPAPGKERELTTQESSPISSCTS
jgi:hypothetical protein